MGEPGRGVERRLEKRLREEDEASVPHAFVVVAAFAPFAAFVEFTQPHLFWLIFVAFGFGLGAADTLAKVRRRDRRLAEETRSASAERLLTAASSEQAPALLTFPQLVRPESPAVAAITDRESRIDGICERLVAEMKGGAAARPRAPPEPRADRLRAPGGLARAGLPRAKPPGRADRRRGSASRPRADGPLGARRVDVRRRREGTPFLRPRRPRRAAQALRRAFDGRRTDRGGGGSYPLLPREPSRPGPARVGGRFGRVGRDAGEPEVRARDPQREDRCRCDGARGSPRRRHGRLDATLGLRRVPRDAGRGASGRKELTPGLPRATAPSLAGRSRRPGTAVRPRSTTRPRWPFGGCATRRGGERSFCSPTERTTGAGWRSTGSSTRSRLRGERLRRGRGSTRRRPSFAR